MNEKTTQDEAPAMPPERWQQIKRIFDQIIEAETGSQEDLLTAACAGDDGLRAEVEKLLRGHEQASGFIEEPAVAKAAQILQISVEDSLIGQQIGPYKVLREIGHGGMGQVYLAVRADDEYKKRVALKIIKRGMDTQEIIRRFRNERQILAGLDHPNIGKLLDGGTTEDGLPYFAMEYVAGKPITDYCDDRKLSTIERLKLFRQVCAAIQFAHQNLVVHRDIKPSNILVTEDGVPKLLDFGIAKVLNPELSGQTIDPTATALRLMTPEYASPEQVRGETITTASDVYSLGVVLYELLTGHRPYRVKSRAPHEILRVVCEEEPEKPSTAVSRVEESTSRDGSKPITLTPESVSRTREGEPEKLRRRLRGDLDNIVLMAMRKEPQRRYATVNQLSEDIRRHLEGMLVIARKDTIGYRVEKFVKRNRVAAVAAALVVITLLGGITATTWQARLAQQRFNDVRKLANSFLFEFHDAIEKLPGATPARELIVKRGLEYLDQLAQQSGNDKSLKLELARAYLRVGDVQCSPFNPNLGDAAGARQSYDKALAIAQSLAVGNSANAEIQYLLAVSYDKAGDGLRITGDIVGAVENRRKAVTIFETLTAGQASNQVRLDFAKCLLNLGDDLGGSTLSRLTLKDFSGAAEQYRKALAICEQLTNADPSSLQAQRWLARSYDRISDVYAHDGRYDVALQSREKALSIRERLASAHPTNGELRRDLAVGYQNTGVAFSNLGDNDKSLENYRKAQKIYEDLVAADPTNAEARRSVGLIYRNIAGSLPVPQNQVEAQALYDKALTIFQSLTNDNPANARTRVDYAETHLRVGDWLSAFGDHTKAVEYYRKGVTILDQRPADSTTLMIDRESARIYDFIGADLEEVGDAVGAMDCKSKALSLREKIAAALPKDSQAKLGLADSYQSLGSLLLDRRENDAALEHYRKAHFIYEELATQNQQDLNSRWNLGLSHRALVPALLRTGKHSEAVEHSTKSLAIFEALSSENPANKRLQLNISYSYEALGNSFAAVGNNEKALEHYRKGLAILEQLAADTKDISYRSSIYWPQYHVATFLLRIGQTAEARRMTSAALAVMKDLVSRPNAEAGTINNYAFGLSMFEPSDLRDSATALAMAKRAVEMSKGTVSYMLNTLALAYHQSGDHAKAIEYAEKASTLLTGNSRRRRDFEADINRFRAAIAYKSGDYARAVELIEKSIPLLDVESVRLSTFEADLAKYKVTAQRQSKR